MSDDPNVPEPSASVLRPPAGWVLYALAAWLTCGAAGVLLDRYLQTHLLPYRWGPDADISMQNLRGEKLEEARAQIHTTMMQGGMIALGALAGALALGLCLADAVKLRRPASFVLAPLGALVGGAAGVGGGYAAMRLHERIEQTSGTPTLTEAIMLQAAAWLCAGLGVALGVWISSGGRRSLVDTLLGGLLAGGLVGALYPPLASLFFPGQNTDRLFPDTGYFPPNAAEGTTGAFLFWAMFTGVLFAVVLGGVSRRAKLQAPPSPSVGP